MRLKFLFLCEVVVFFFVIIVVVFYVPLKTCHRCFYSIVYLSLFELSAMLVLRFLYMLSFLFVVFIYVCVMISFVPVGIDMAHHVRFFYCCRCLLLLFVNVIVSEPPITNKNQKPTITSETCICFYLPNFPIEWCWQWPIPQSRTCCFISEDLCMFNDASFSLRHSFTSSWMEQRERYYVESVDYVLDLIVAFPVEQSNSHILIEHDKNIWQRVNVSWISLSWIICVRSKENTMSTVIEFHRDIAKHKESMHAHVRMNKQKNDVKIAITLAALNVYTKWKSSHCFKIHLHLCVCVWFCHFPWSSLFSH